MTHDLGCRCPCHEAVTAAYEPEPDGSKPYGCRSCTVARYPDHTPLKGGGCLDIAPHECDLVAGRHCASCGREVRTEQGRVPGNSHTFHVGTRERLWQLETERRHQLWESERRKAAGR